MVKTKKEIPMKDNKHITILYTLVIMLTIWCTWSSSNIGGFDSKVIQYRTEVHTFQRQVANLIDIANSQEKQEEELKAMEEMLPVNGMEEKATE